MIAPSRRPLLLQQTIFTSSLDWHWVLILVLQGYALQPQLLMSLQATYFLTICFPQAQWAGKALNNVKDEAQLLAPHMLVWEDAGYHRRDAHGSSRGTGGLHS